MTTQIDIQIGMRRGRTGLTLSNIRLNHLLLNDVCIEDIKIIEPKYIITTGYHSENIPLKRAAQDTSRLFGTVITKDMSDAIEHEGIAEFWHPLDFEENEVKTVGKLKRHWANKFLTYDTIRYFDETLGTEDEVVFFENSVELAENKQITIIQKILQAVENYPDLRMQNYIVFVSPQDRSYLLNYQASLSILQAFSAIKFSLQLFDINSIFTVSRSQNIIQGLLNYGWQDKGFFACVDMRMDRRRCFGIREPSSGRSGFGPHHITKSEHSACNRRVFEETGSVEDSILGSFDLLDIVALGDSITSLAGVLTSNERNNFTDLAFQSNANAATQTRIDSYKEKLREKKQEYIP